MADTAEPKAAPQAPVKDVEVATAAPSESSGNSSELRNRKASKDDHLMPRKVITIVKSEETGARPGEIVVNYDSTKHFRVLFQWRGSVWPRVLPFCIFNTLMMFICDFWIVTPLENMNIVFTGSGRFTQLHQVIVCNHICFFTHVVILLPVHGFLTIMVSFLVIRRAAMSTSRYDKAGENLTKCLKGARDLVSVTVSISSRYLYVQHIAQFTAVPVLTCQNMRAIRPFKQRASRILLQRSGATRLLTTHAFLPALSLLPLITNPTSKRHGIFLSYMARSRRSC